MTTSPRTRRIERRLAARTLPSAESTFTRAARANWIQLLRTLDPSSGIANDTARRTIASLTH